MKSLKSLGNSTLDRVLNTSRQFRYTEVYPINNDQNRLKYTHETSTPNKDIKVGDNISIIENRYVLKGTVNNNTFYSMDDTKFKTGKVKAIRESSLSMNDRAKRRSPPSLKMEIVLTKFGVVDRNLNDRMIPEEVVSYIGEFLKDEVIIIQDYITQAEAQVAGGGPSHYYRLDVVGGRRQKRTQTRKSSKLKRKTSKTKLKRKKSTKGNK